MNKFTVGFGASLALGLHLVTFGAETGEPAVARVLEGGLTATGDYSFAVTSPADLVYENGGWWAAIELSFPHESYDYYDANNSIWGSAYYSDPDSVRISAHGATWSAAELLESGTLAHSNSVLKASTVTASYKRALLAQHEKYMYLDTITWRVGFTKEEVQAAVKRGEEALTFTLNAGGEAWEWSGIHGYEGSKTGVAYQDYTITVPLEGLVLRDDEGSLKYAPLEVTAFTMSEAGAHFTVRTAAGLRYTVLGGNTPDSITEEEFSLVASDTRTVLTAPNFEGSNVRFYRVQASEP